MAGCYKTQGIGIFADNLAKYANEISRINKVSLYNAAGAIADEVNRALQAMPVRDDGLYGTENKKLLGATESEKEQIIANFGINKFALDAGDIKTALGFTGYVNTKSSKFNGRVPTGMLMQCIEYGTDFRQGTHTISKAKSKAKKIFESKVQETQDKEINKIFKNGG